MIRPDNEIIILEGKTVPYKKLFCPSCQKRRMYIETIIGVICEICHDDSFIDTDKMNEKAKEVGLDPPYTEAIYYED